MNEFGLYTKNDVTRYEDLHQRYCSSHNVRTHHVREEKPVDKNTATKSTESVRQGIKRKIEGREALICLSSSCRDKRGRCYLRNCPIANKDTVKVLFEEYGKKKTARLECAKKGLQAIHDAAQLSSTPHFSLPEAAFPSRVVETNITRSQSANINIISRQS